MKNCDILQEMCPQILVKSEYNQIDEDNQCVPAVWIVPCESTVKSKQPNCTTVVLTHAIRICAVVRCPGNLRNDFDQSIDEDRTELLGSYVIGADLLSKIKQCIDLFNCNIRSINKGKENCFSELNLTRIYKPDTNNGHLIHCFGYETKIYY